MNKVFLSLGSNIGNRVEQLESAIEYIQAHPSITEVTVSSFYETEPVGYLSQPWFINCVVGLRTDLKPDQLLDCCELIEIILKKTKLFTNGPRTLDIDVLTYGSIKLNTCRLQLPHPRMFERAFVMIPLLEIATVLEHSQFSANCTFNPASKIVKLEFINSEENVR